MAITSIQGFESRIFNAGGVASSGGTPQYDTTNPRSGLACLRCNGALTHAIYSLVGVPTAISFAFWVRVDTRVDTADFLEIAGAGNPHFSLRFTSSNKVTLYIYTRGTPDVVHASQESTSTVPTGEYVRFDVSLNASANPWVISWAINGVDQTGLSPALAASAGLLYFDLGNNRVSGANDVYFDDLIVGATSDYKNLNYRVLGFKPNGVGTHNLDAATSTYYFKDIGGTETALTTSETTSYEVIDDVPLGASTDHLVIKQPATTFADPNANGTNTAWTGDYTGIDDALRDPGNPQIAGDGASISSGTAGALEDTGYSNPTYVAGATYTLKIYSSSGAKRGLSVSVDGGTNFTTVHVANAAAAWRNVDVTSQITDQTTLDAFTTRWRCDSTAGGGGAGTVTIFAAYLDIRKPPSTAYYAEYAFENNSEPDSPVAVKVIGLIDRDSAIDTFDEAQLRANGNSGVIWSASSSDTNEDINEGIFATAPGGAAWTTSIFDGLTVRWGFTNNVLGAARLVDMMIEAAFPPAVAVYPPPPPPVYVDGARRRAIQMRKY